MVMGTAAPGTTTQRRWFWWIYAACWLPYFGLILNFVSPEASLAERLAAAASSVAPLAVFGVAVVRLGRRWAWTGARRGAFFARHVAAALVYAVLSALGVLGLFALMQWWNTGRVPAETLSRQSALLPMFMSLVFYVALAGITQALAVQKRLREEEARAARAETERARAETLRTQAELRALRAQLNPHFLFNTLHTLLALVRRDARAAEEALEQFGELLHYSLGVHQDAREDVPFAEEWEFVENYLALERLRLGERLRLEVDVDDEALDCRVPTFSLQPLVENAVRHGIAPRPEGGRLWITAGVRDEELVLEVRDDGPGAPSGGPSSNGLGLRLVRQRIEAYFEGRGRVDVDADSGDGFTVRIVVPAAWSPRRDPTLGSPAP